MVTLGTIVMKKMAVKLIVTGQKIILLFVLMYIMVRLRVFALLVWIKMIEESQGGGVNEKGF